MTGLSRIGFGLAFVSLGATILFGSPIVASWNAIAWEMIGFPLLAIGFSLLVWGSISAFRSHRNIVQERKTQREAEADAANVELVAATAKLSKLKYFLSVATEYDDSLRAEQLAAEIEATEADQRAAVRRLAGAGIKVSIPESQPWRPATRGAQ